MGTKQRLILPLTLTALSVGGAAKAEGFVLTTYETPAQFAARSNPAKSAGYWGRWTAAAGEMAKAGVLKGGSALVAKTDAVGASAQRPHDAMSGYFAVEVADEAAAVGWAGRLLKAGAARVEVRATQSNPAMSAAAPH